ncbi:YidC/Oxa1 family membrane protein insertase [Natroniella sp. ANB-PHB2]|uniref:YidC/Oxa1 family membrane protein insertase n=1 Tax=Natroniella sp. ANB-PHB2 TaxID=3384444 RepID=UPI0038D4071E
MVNLFSVGVFGWLGEFMKTLLTQLYGFTGSYGSAIILLTLGIRLLLFPLVSKQTRSMKKMQKLQPLMEELKEKYGDNKEKYQEETMKLYQKHKVNPAAGCLPLLVQMPILIALFRSLQDWEELAGEAFLLVPDLSGPYLPLVILTGLVMLGQSLMTQKLSGKESNNKMALFMPLFIILIGFRLPAGVLVYWFTSNLIMAVQQYFLYKEPTDLKEEST